MAQDTGTKEKGFVESPGDAHWRNTVSGNLASLENSPHNSVNGDEPAGNYGKTDGKSILENEQNSNGNWNVNLGDQSDKKSSKKSSGKGLLKKFGPTGGIIALVLGGIFGLGGTTGVMSTMLVNLKENVMSKDQQNFTSDPRSRRILNRRLTGESTAGACGVVKFACRYTIPSERQLKKARAQGIEFIDAEGNVIEHNRLIGGTRPDKIRTADGLEIEAKNLRTELRTNTKLRVALKKVYSPRWANWADDKAVAMFKRLGNITKAIPDSLSNAKNADEVAEAADGLTKTTPKDSAKITDEFKDAIKKNIDKGTKKISRKVGGAISKSTALVQVTCMASKAPNALVNLVKAYRMTQYAKLAYSFLTVADKIKKGEATDQEVSNFATVLIQTYIKNGVIVKKSALDSDLLKYSIGLGTAGNGSKYIPTLGGALAQYTAIVNSDVVKTSCETALSPGVDAAAMGLDAALSASGVGIIASGLVALTTFALAEVAAAAASGAVDLALSHIDIMSIVGYFAGDDTAGAKGTDLGDISAVSWTNSMADQASYVGNAPLTTAQNVAFNEQIVQPTKLAWAEEDRLEYSPFDASNPNTFLGSIATKFLPYFGSISNPFSLVSSIASISTSSFYNIVNPKASAQAVVDKNLCKQNEVLAKEENFAIGPACDIQYGVPAEYMGIEPDQVVVELADQLTDEGEPKEDSELADWIEVCNVADQTNLSECVINDRQTALYSLYQIDKRIIDGMDNDLEANNTSSTSSSSASGDAVGEPEFEMAQPQVNGNSWPGKENGRFSDDDLVELSFSPGSKMYKQAAAAMEEMNRAYHAETGQNFVINEAYRTYETQSSYYAQGITQARPGTSNHGWGLAADINTGDFSSSIYKWLDSNAHKYGFVNPDWAKNRSNPGWYKDEPWHWEYARKVF